MASTAPVLSPLFTPLATSFILAIIYARTNTTDSCKSSLTLQFILISAGRGNVQKNQFWLSLSGNSRLLVSGITEFQLLRVVSKALHELAPTCLSHSTPLHKPSSTQSELTVHYLLDRVHFSFCCISVHTVMTAFSPLLQDQIKAHVKCHSFLEAFSDFFIECNLFYSMYKILLYILFMQMSLTS